MHSDDEFVGECRECQELLETISEYLEGELTDEMRRDLLVHAQSCSRCAALLHSLRRLVGYCRVEPGEEIPAYVRQQLWVTIRQEIYSEDDSAGT
ncbi:zf-HC2 domain-containing protein [candidate division WOR-3 bacterium]|nr:zf-HC2 domain-containing protein [candidate division WOR-3 bacterium]